MGNMTPPVGVSPLRVALPFQTVETVNESAQDRQRSLRYAPGFGEEEWRNRLIWGDKKYVLPSLLAEFAGQVNLIYVDPPFDTGADFSFIARVPEDPEEENGAFSFTKEPSIIEHKAYRDMWGRGLESYLQWFYETTTFLYELLTEDGSIYVHLDAGVIHYAKIILDEVFGHNGFRNEIVWKRSSAHSDSKQGMSQYGRVTDSLLFYTKGLSWTWHQHFQPYAGEYVSAKYGYTEPNGRRFKSTDLTAAKPGGDTDYEWRGKRPPRGRYWAYSKANMEKFEAEDRIHYTTTGFPRLKHYLDEMAGITLQNYWTDIPPINSQAIERLGYPTQKPEALLERIIAVSSNEGHLVLDCYCGSGNNAAVSEMLGRRWIVCDLSRFAIHTTRKRLLSIPGVRPFTVQNLGKYERQLWAGTEFGDNKAAARQRAYVEFVLKLANATPTHGYTWLHGVKAGRMIHIGAVDAPVSVGDVTQIAAEFKRAVGTGKDAPTTNGVDVLGWDFAFELNEVAKQQAAGLTSRCDSSASPAT
jgi:adenine-specific DNA-methyltransferase